MKIIEPGHVYLLAPLDGDEVSELTFVNRNHGNDYSGTNCQEVLRALIDRVEFLEGELPSIHNPEILHYLRMALVHFESRALERKVEKQELDPERVSINSTDGHFKLTQ